MKSTISPKENDRSHNKWDSLRALKPDQLAERWRELYGTAMPARLRRSLIIQALAYRLQEKAFGGLKPATRRLLETAAGRASEHRTAKLRTRRSAQTGTVLVREWHGTKHQVTVLKDGFMFRGKHFEPSSRTTACPSLTTSRRLRGSFQAASIQSLSERRAVIRSTVPRASASSPRGPAEVT